MPENAAEVDYDIVITRRDPPPQPAPFECAICERLRTPDRWARPAERPPVCPSCEAAWPSRTRLRPTGITRGDFRNLRRLDAVIQALTWETMNGRRRAQ